MSGFQRLTAIGNLGKDPEGFNGGCRFSVAVTERWKKDNEPQERTEWLNCTAFGGLGGVCEQYLKKGSKVYIEGRLRTESYEKEGVKQWSTGIILSGMTMLDSRGDNQGGYNQQEATNQYNQSHAQQNSAPEDFDDSIPF